MSIEVISRIGSTSGTWLNGAPFYMSGKVVYVSSSGSNSNSGLTYALPKLTTAAAVALATDHGCDIICFKSGFRETITSTVTLTSAMDGLALVSEGSGSNAATLTMSGNVYLDCAGDSQIVSGINFAHTGAASDFMVRGAGSLLFAPEFLNCSFAVSVASNGNAGTGLKLLSTSGRVEGCTFTSGVAGAGYGLWAAGACNGLRVKDCTFSGGSTGWAGDIACKFDGSATQDFLIDGCVLTGRSRINLITGCKGIIRFDSPDDIGAGCGVDWTY